MYRMLEIPILFPMAHDGTVSTYYVRSMLALHAVPPLVSGQLGIRTRTRYQEYT